LNSGLQILILTKKLNTHKKMKHQNYFKKTATAVICALVLAFTAQAQTQVTEGLKTPRLNTGQRNTIQTSNNPYAKGQVIYNTDNNCLEYWNGTKWASLCLGTANISLGGNPCGAYDPANPPLAAADGSGTPCTFTPTDDPACVVPSGQAYQVYLTAGAAYATLAIDELTSAFSVTFSENNSANTRIAVVRVVNNCSGEFQDFLFTQAGASCPSSISPFHIKNYPTNDLCGGAVQAEVELNGQSGVSQTGIEYIWEYGGVVVHTGDVWKDITRAGHYKVWAGLLGCGSAAEFDVTGTNTSSQQTPVISATNGGVLCSGGNVYLNVENSSAGGGDAEVWYHNGHMSTIGNPSPLSGAAAAGEWYMAWQNNLTSCTTRGSNVITLTDQTSGAAALPAPVATVNGQPLTAALTICKNGTLELKVTNAAVYPTGTVFEWFDNGVSISSSTDAVIYTVAGNKTSMRLAVKASNNSNGCPNTVQSAPQNVTLTAPAATTINNGAAKAPICGATPATLSATNTSGAAYEWFRGGAIIGGATAATYSTSQPGTYTVRYKDANACFATVSAPITVEQSAAIDISWVVEPVTPVNTGDSKNYSVDAAPAPDTYQWSSSNTTVATVTPIGNGQTANVNFLTDGVTTIRATATNSCGSQFVEKAITASQGCTPITSVSLTPAGGSVIKKYFDISGNPKTAGDGSASFSVAKNNGSADNVFYEWYVGSTKQSNTSSSFTYNITTPAVSGDYLIKGAVGNNCTPTALQTTAATVRVVRDAAPDVSGKYLLSGKTCFDVKRGNYDVTCGLEAQRTDGFASTKTFTYTFSSPTGSSYTNLTFDWIDNDGLLASDPTYAGNVLTVVFKNNINSIAAGVTKLNPKKLTIIPKYKDNTSIDRQIELLVSVQDCACGCTVKSTLPGGWLTFMCYNLGADPDMSIAQQMAFTPKKQPTASDDTTHAVYGYLHQWGRVADGHQKRNSEAMLGPYTGAFDSNGQIPSSATAYYGKHVFDVMHVYYDWRTPQLPTLWNSGTTAVPVKTPNDPCPPGWRVPTQLEWSSIFNGSGANFSIYSSWASVLSSGNRVRWSGSSSTPGIEITTDGITTSLFLPTTGVRSSASSALGSSVSYGFYWSSTVNGEGSYNLSFLNGSVTPADHNYRSAGFSVRCVAE
jgi:uncharacterized protein (TIGR02145 family)